VDEYLVGKKFKKSTKELFVVNNVFVVAAEGIRVGLGS